MNAPLVIKGTRYTTLVDYGTNACRELYEEQGTVVAVLPRGNGTAILHPCGVGLLREDQVAESKPKTAKVKTNRGKAV